MAILVEEIYARLWGSQEFMDAEMREVVKIDQTRLQGEKGTHCEEHLHWGRIANKAESDLRQEENRVNHIIWNEARQRARKKIKDTFDKETEGRINELSYQDTIYQAAAATLEARRLFTADLRTLADIMVHRSKLLQNMTGQGA